MKFNFRMKSATSVRLAAMVGVLVFSIDTAMAQSNKTAAELQKEWLDEVKSSTGMKRGLDIDADRDWYAPDKLKDGGDGSGGESGYLPNTYQANPSDAYSFGALSGAGIGRTVGANSPYDLNKDLNDLDIQDAFMDSSRGAGMLQMGCSNLDYENSMQAVLNVDTDSVKKYFDSNLSSYMVTTLFNSPSVVELFKNVEDFGSKRVKFMQDRCSAIEDKNDDSVLALRSQILSECVSRLVTDYNDSRQITNAYKRCLVGDGKSKWDDNTFASTAKDVVVENKWSGTFFDHLKNTSLCSSRQDDATDNTVEDCALMAFMHNVRWCTPRADGTNSRGCYFDGKIRLSQPSISQAMIYESALMVARAYLDHGYEIAQNFANGVRWWAGDSNTGYEAAVAYSKVMLDKGAVQDNRGKQHVRSVEPLKNAFFDETALEQEFKQHFACSSMVGKNTFPTSSYLVDILDDADSGYIDLYNNRRVELDRLDGIPMEPDRLIGDVFVASPTVESVRDVYSSAKGAELIGVSVACTMLHDLPVTMLDFLSMTELEEGSAAAARLSIAQKIAQQASENIIVFMLHKLNLAKLELAYLPNNDPNLPAPHVKHAIDVAMNGLELKLSELRDSENSKKLYSDSMLQINK